MGEIIYIDNEDTENSPERGSSSKKYIRTQMEEELPEMAGPNEEIEAGLESGSRLNK